MGNNTGIVINRNLYKLRIDPIKDFAPGAEVASVPLVLYVNASKNSAFGQKPVDDLLHGIDSFELLLHAQDNYIRYIGMRYRRRRDGLADTLKS